MSLSKRLLEMRSNKRFKNVYNNSPFEISIESTDTTSAIDAYNRKKNLSAQTAYNSKITAFWREVESELKSSVTAVIDQDRILSKSIRANVYKRDNEVFKLGFSFVEEGVYVHKGVGRGYVMNGKTVVKTSRTPGFNRHPKIWFNTVIERNMVELEKIIIDYYKDISINTTRIYIK